MSDECKLRRANGEPDVHCDGGACVFWRALRHVHSGADAGSGCAIQHYRLLGDERTAEWLLSVKSRYESIERRAIAEAS